ncbi:MAG: aromatic ring-hydroxylating dioxygenase subunit alpha [Burkholderiales bacterium]
MSRTQPVAVLQQSPFEATHRPVSEARHAPGFIYTSPEVYERERAEIFMRDWLCVGREEEVANAGDYMALRIVGEPLLVARAEDGSVNAFSNICAHRGVEVASGSGNKRAFTCPFHGWTYDHHGRLVGAPHMGTSERFDPASCRLPPVRLTLWKGWIFVNFSDTAPEFSVGVRQLEQDFDFLRQEECALAVKTVSEVDCNWKLVVENLIDLYHVNVVHRGTNGKLFTPDAFRFEARPDGGYVAEYNSGPSTFSRKPVFGKAPWLEDRPDNFSMAGRLAPNFTLFARVDTVHPYVIWPLGVDRARIIVYTLLPKIYFDQPNFAERVEAYRAFQKQVVQEDSAMLESMQNGLCSGRFEPGRMADIECGVQHVVKSYLDRMFPRTAN